MSAMSRFLVLAASLFAPFGCSDSSASKPLVFYVLGDWGRKGEPNQLVLANQMNEWTKNENAKFIVTVGDNFYNDGVADVDDPHWKESFENVYNGNNLIRKPWYVSLGNHDYRGNVEAQIAYKKIDSRWNLPARYYTHLEDLGDGTRVRFIFIDTTPFEKDYYQDPVMHTNLISQDTIKQKNGWIALRLFPTLTGKLLLAIITFIQEACATASLVP
jgi:tartrate-resistant acid phosphatase type 5